ncbi:hypothetical protein Y032_0001g155 [Ancylostoma ceylanicum]|uniref:Uncharacterized protein n=1 Tax=Ancylostoma ceylanicum TaxID=53326 RepID=A0A016W4H8_9BILA|nr:hypothetical protein Y032_0001g155 [Ancylostoma ceylanicum]
MTDHIPIKHTSHILFVLGQPGTDRCPITTHTVRFGARIRTSPTDSHKGSSVGCESYISAEGHLRQRIKKQSVLFLRSGAGNDRMPSNSSFIYLFIYIRDADDGG